MRGLLKNIVIVCLTATVAAGVMFALNGIGLRADINEEKEIKVGEELELEFKQHSINDYCLKFYPKANEPGYYLFEIDGGFSAEAELRFDDKDVLTSGKGSKFKLSYDLDGGHFYTLHVKGESKYSDEMVNVIVYYIDPESPSVVEINSETFPNQKFRNFVLTNYDIDGDMYLSEVEIEHANEFTSPKDNVFYEDITGVKYLTSMKKITCTNNGNFESLDVSGMKSLEYLDCPYNGLISVNLSGCSNLKELDLSANDYLAELNLDGCTGLVIINVMSTGFSKLDVSSCKDLETLWCGHYSKIEELDLKNNPKLKDLSCGNSQLKKLDISKCHELVELACGKNKLTELDLSCNPKLEIVSCSENDIEFLDLSNCKALKEIYCEDNPIKDKTVYIPNDGVQHTDPSEFKYVVVKPSDWTFGGVSWTDDHKAFAKYTCSKIKDYTCTREMTVEKKTTQPQCEKEGSDVYTATISADLARDGKARGESKKEVLPQTGHSWGEWQVTKKATVASEGEETRICKNDPSHKQTRKIAALTPTPTTKPTAKPTAKPEPTKKADPAKKPAKPTATPTAKPEPTKKTEPTKKAEPTKSADVSFKLNKTKVNIVCGKEDKLKATLKGASGKISWKTSDKKIAAVDANGKVTAKMAGTVTIIASAAGKTATCEVTVLYKDVTNTKDFWYKPTNCLTAKGVVKGYDKQTRFKPANKCTRAQMVTFIWRLQGEPSPKSSTCKFSDVKSTDYFYKACIWGNEKHIVEGYKDGTFGPQIVCARRHAVTFLWRLAGKPDPKTKKNKFSDVKKSDYFYKATLWASEKKILAGYEDGTFRPNGDCLRRQMVTFLYKYDKNINKKG